MRIIREHVCEGRGGIAGYYAIVELDDGSRVELNSRAPRDVGRWLEAAEAYQESIAEPEPSIEIEAEDGYVV